ncbi:hypothetical protein PHYPSEUDO_002546 [Phytophthora pseudosyringae]|uniref:Uncharacterized protein n=1 Tax=Phytophthora pseudosyringae TaxID=221518 RepID=A0A8T1VY28_9STRA|nr:hypothetical protein PHYPSEUDO_002546 [Phytophthora pseudosyringae]
MRSCYSNEDHGEPSDAIVHKSPHPDIAIPDITMWQVAEKQAKINADTPAFRLSLLSLWLAFDEDALGTESCTSSTLLYLLLMLGDAQSVSDVDRQGAAHSVPCKHPRQQSFTNMARRIIFRRNCVVPRRAPLGLDVGDDAPLGGDVGEGAQAQICDSLGSYRRGEPFSEIRTPAQQCDLQYQHGELCSADEQGPV